MSVPGTSATSVAAAGLPVASQALEPKWVRDGSPATQKAYETALAFEQALVEQLSQALAKSSGLGGASSPEEGSMEGAPGAGEGAGGEGDSELSMLLPQALTSGVMNAGGLGLAAQLTQQLAAEQGDATNSAGASSPGAGSGVGAQPLGAAGGTGAQPLGAAGGVDAPRGASS
ncbi:MAG TPA: hypothetical protein VL979_14495 [Solirubrobacteraceae bacterium]|nr:hypothetical protein [Solirubrobacteraceae bacterium]